MKVLPSLKSVLEGPAVWEHPSPSVVAPQAAVVPSSPTSPIEVEAVRVVDVQCILGECVIYDDRLNSLFWTDIDGKAVYKLLLDHLDDKTNGDDSNTPLSRRLFQKMVGAFALTDDTDVFLLGFEDGFQLFNMTDGEALSPYSHGPPVNPKGQPTRLNDGRCDRSGKHMICGGFYGKLPDTTISVFTVERCPVDEKNDDYQKSKLRHKTLMESVRVTNSLCFSPDGGTMYFCDSPTRTVKAFDYDEESGTITMDTARQVYQWPEPNGFPDGACIDADGYLWNAIWRSGEGPGRIHRVNPRTGQVEFIVHMPDSTSQCTCCCFGGPNLDVLFITTAIIYQDAKVEPNAGSVYAVKVPFRGLPESRFCLR